MALTDADKQNIRDAEELKNEIRKELRATEHNSGLSEFQKQLILLFLGFVLTAVVGGALTAWWKSKELSNQRQYLAQQRALDKIYSLMDRTSKEVATTIAAADDVLVLYESEWTPEEVAERWRNWTGASRAWRVNCQILRAQMAATFSDQKIVSLFDEIIRKRKQLGNAIVNLPRNRQGVAKDKLDTANELNNNIMELLKQCVALMTAQARRPSQE